MELNLFTSYQVKSLINKIKALSKTQLKYIYINDDDSGCPEFDPQDLHTELNFLGYARANSHYIFI